MRLLILSAALVVAAPAAAQETNGAGLRYLAWPGKAERPAGQAQGQADDLRRTRLIPHAGASFATVNVRPSAPSPLPATPDRQPRQGLTPADAWLRPVAAPPVYAAAPTPMPSQPMRTPTPEVRQPQGRLVQPSPRQAPPTPTPAPVQAVAQPARRVEQARPAPPPAQPQPAPAQAEVQPAESVPADPMAPRRDALIYSVQRPAEGSGQGGEPPRYYSVHRQNGRQPDAIPQPTPHALDAMPVQLTDDKEQGSSLADPPEPPQMVRNRDGKLVPLTPAGEDGDRQ